MMGKWRSSAAYRIAFAYAAAFAAGTALLGIIVYWSMHVAFTHQLDAMITDEAQTLVSEYKSDGGDGELADAIAQREGSRAPERLFYAVFAPDGRRVMGSLRTSIPELGIHDLSFTDPAEGIDSARGLAIDLSPQRRLLVAADREWIERSDQTVIAVFAFGFLGVCALGVAGALALGAYLRRRLRALSDGAGAIMGGDIRRRMPVGPLHDEFDQLAVALNRMLERIEGLLDNLRQVTAGVAHELRTPLSRLRNHLERGVSDIGSTDPAAPIIEDALRRVDDILALFAAILRIAEIESGETRRLFERVDLSLLATELAETYAPVARDGGRNMLWSVEPGVTVLGDRELLAQACINLLENARTHTPSGTLIRLTLIASGGYACLQVTDNGPGIAKADRSRAVQRFIRLDHGRTTNGHGLGLSLVSVVAGQHNGKLQLRDSGPGLAATIQLPLSPVTPQISPEPSDGD
jgi:signal transduction histidine kinase